MVVKELIEILKKCDKELPIATHANNHSYMSNVSGKCRVALLKSYAGDHVIIGNINSKDLNKPNYYIDHEIDDLGSISD